MQMITDGSPEADQLGFTLDKFRGWLLKSNKVIIFMYIRSLFPNSGHVQTLFKDLLKKGYTLKITASGDTMDHICEKMGFQRVVDHHPFYDQDFDMWVKYSPNAELEDLVK